MQLPDWDQVRTSLSNLYEAFRNGVYADELQIALVALLLGFLVHVIAIVVARRVVRRIGWRVEETFFKRLKSVTRILFPLIALQIASPQLTDVMTGDYALAQRILTLAILAESVHLIIVLLAGFEQHIERTYPVDVPDNYAARRLQTQVAVLTRVVTVVVVVVAFALALMTIPGVRELGTSLLASAGVAGLAIGLAARPMLENLIAGVQLALTQPINIGDVVVMEGEFGTVEEISTTYIIVRVWDQRRLVVPLSKVLTEPFQNWTRRSAEMLGTVYLFTDYTVPVQAVREELERIVHPHEKWDGRVCNLQVTDATERSLQLRALISATTSSAAWDLRVHVREKLVEFLQRAYPQCLPRTRVELSPDAKSNGHAARTPEPNPTM